MNEPHWDHLIHGHLDDALSASEHAEFEALMLESAAARRRFWELAEVHGLAREAARLTWAEDTDQSVPNKLRNEGARRVWLSWRPLTAAAAGIVFGMFCTAVAFGYSMPRMVERVLSLVNAGFEEPVAPLPDGIPLRFGVWSGDISEIVGGQQGIAPHEGQRMFRFLRSDSNDGFLSRAYHGNMYQFIDIRPWREAISSGTAVVDWSAWFDCVREASGMPVEI